MEASAVPRAAPSGVPTFKSSGLLRVASDSHLVAQIRQGRAAAFEIVYDRHHRAILSFCRHMLGDVEEAKDAVQHTFFAAYSDLIGSEKPIHLRAWLFTIARNRCYSVLRARREHPTSEITEAATEGLATQVQRRQDLRDLVLDMQRLPEDQRAALVLAELDALSHQEISEVLGVPRDKVKALVFQARESLIASRTARETDCADIREQLATQRGAALRRSNLRRHLRECEGCRDFRKQVERQRRQLAVVLPVVGVVAARDGLPIALGGAGAIGGGLIASSALKGGLGKVAIGALLTALGTAGTIAATSGLHLLVSKPAQPLVHRQLHTPGEAARASAVHASAVHTAAHLRPAHLAPVRLRWAPARHSGRLRHGHGLMRAHHVAVVAAVAHRGATRSWHHGGPPPRAHAGGNGHGHAYGWEHGRGNPHHSGGAQASVAAGVHVADRGHGHGGPHGHAASVAHGQQGDGAHGGGPQGGGDGHGPGHGG